MSNKWWESTVKKDCWGYGGATSAIVGKFKAIFVVSSDAYNEMDEETFYTARVVNASTLKNVTKSAKSMWKVCQYHIFIYFFH